MNIDDLTIGQLKELQSISPSGNKLPFEVGKAYLFRTVTHIEVGRVARIVGKFVELGEASWIADTGRYHDCLKKGVFNEVEPYPLYTGINTDSLINYAPWPHDLPTELAIECLLRRAGKWQEFNDG
ncbi:hypothetical protein [uncultured Paraglaciecola sp.]|uniref:hypothetical protein n=1 Tax=uncultured Paraglaciecola sp. TaxID=1765024 RepID=UPI0026120AFA|nr:hypothetical protein [uncultured Paraglaciecola sp.]